MKLATADMLRAESFKLEDVPEPQELQTRFALGLT